MSWSVLERIETRLRDVATIPPDLYTLLQEAAEEIRHLEASLDDSARDLDFG